MSDEGRVAKLYAEVGFQVSDSEAERVKQVFSSIKDKIDEAIEKTAQFASDLMKLSKGTGLSTTVLQNFHKMGVAAGVTTDEVDSLLSATNELANKSYWGFTNQLSMWGIYLSRSETAASALMKILRGMNGQSYNRQLEIAREAGIDITTALMMLDHFKENGFKVEDAFGLDEKTVREMHQVNVEFNKLDYSWEMFYNRLVGTQSETILSNAKMIGNFFTKIQESLIKLAKTSFGQGLLNTIIRLLPFSNFILGQLKVILPVFNTTFRLFKGTLFAIKWGVIIGVIAKLIGMFGLFKGFNFFGAMQETFDRFLNSSGKLGIMIKETLNTVLEGALGFVEEYIPEFGKNSGISQLLRDAKDGKIFDALGKWFDYLVGRLVAIWNTIFPKIKSFAKFIVDYTKTVLRIAVDWFFDKAHEFWDTVVDGMLVLLHDIFEALPIPGMGKAARAMQEKLLNRHGYAIRHGQIVPIEGFSKKEAGDLGLRYENDPEIAALNKKFKSTLDWMMTVPPDEEEGGSPEDIKDAQAALGVFDEKLQNFITRCEEAGQVCPNPQEQMLSSEVNQNNVNNFSVYTADPKEAANEIKLQLTTVYDRNASKLGNSAQDISFVNKYGNKISNGYVP